MTEIRFCVDDLEPEVAESMFAVLHGAKAAVMITSNGIHIHGDELERTALLYRALQSEKFCALMHKALTAAEFAEESKEEVENANEKPDQG